MATTPGSAAPRSGCRGGGTVAGGGPRGDRRRHGSRHSNASRAVVLEAFIQPLERPIRRSMDDAIGLAGWVLEE